MGNKYQYCVLLRKAPDVTFTIAPTPSDATVKINGIEQSSITVSAGDEVSFEVSKTGYKILKGSAIVKRTTTWNCELEDTCKVTVSAVPADPEYTIVINSTEFKNTYCAKLDVDAGSDVTVTVSREHYVTQTKTFTNLTGNVFWNLKLEYATVEE